MAGKTDVSERGSKRAHGVLARPKRMVEPDDVITREESAVIAEARREMRAGKYITLAQLEDDLAHKRPPRRRKTA